MPRLRLGVALVLPTPVAHEVDGLRRALGDASRTRVAPHITLVPPVNVRQEHLGAALAVLRAAAAAAPPTLTVTLGPPASFLPANAVLYLPVAGDLPALGKLRERVWTPPLTRTLTWPFVAHVTLADESPVERIAAALAAMADYQVTAIFDRIHLLVERRPEGAPGPRWLPLADVTFGPPAIVSVGGPLAVELTRSRLIDPEAQALLATDGSSIDTHGEGIVVTARREGGVVGVGRAWFAADGCRAAVVVAGEHRNQGIGRHIAVALEAAAADAGWACECARTLSEEPAG